MIMKTSELRTKTIAELQVVLSDLLKEQVNLLMRRGSGDTTLPKQNFKSVRRGIACVKTILSEKLRDKA
jgi:large subunit ribosomal protein L29